MMSTISARNHRKTQFLIRNATLNSPKISTKTRKTVVNRLNFLT